MVGLDEYQAAKANLLSVGVQVHLASHRDGGQFMHNRCGVKVIQAVLHLSLKFVVRFRLLVCA